VSPLTDGPLASTRGGSGAPMLLIHGLGSSRMVWNRTRPPLWGGRDRLLSPRAGPRLAEAGPGAEPLEPPGLGHTPMLDHPEQVARLILEWTVPGRSRARAS
jgi:pimeloyl-ACP methyl ester carboxylesterase